MERLKKLTTTRAPRTMLFLRRDQAIELLQVCESQLKRARSRWRKAQALKQYLIIRYFMLNGLSPMELSNGRIEHLDPVNCELFLPKRHCKKNCITDIDAETVKLQIIYSGSRRKGPLVRSRKTHGHIRPKSFCRLVKLIAARTTIPNKQSITPLILKRTFARLYLKTPGNTVGGLQKAFSHKHLWSTAHYVRFILDDVKTEKNRMMNGLEKDINTRKIITH